MFVLLRLFTIISVLQITVLGDVSKISDAQACTEFCSVSNNVGSFRDGRCTCENVDNKDAQNVFRETRQAEQVDPNLYSEDLTDSERVTRCSLLGSRSLLRHQDADRVVKYFISDGPSLGHSYFTQAVDANDDINKEYKTENNPLTSLYPSTDDSNDPVIEKQALQLVQDNFDQPDYRNALVNAPYDPYDPVNGAPLLVNLQRDLVDTIYEPVLQSSNYILGSPLHSLRSTLRDRLLGATLPRRNIRPRLNPLKQFSNALLGLVREPVHEGLVSAHDLLHRLTGPDTVAYSPYVNGLSTIGRSAIGNIVHEPNPIVGISNENAQLPTADLQPTSDNAQEPLDIKTSANLVPPIQRTNIPNRNFPTIPYNQRYFMPLYPLQNNPHGALLQSIPRAYALQPASSWPQTVRSAQSTDVTATPKPQDSSNCENNTSSDIKDSSADPANVTAAKPTENINTADSSITKRDSDKEKTLKNKSKTK